MKKLKVIVLAVICSIGVNCNLSAPAEDGTGKSQSEKNSDKTVAGGGVKIKTANSEATITQVEGFAPPNRGGHSIQITNFAVDMSGGYEFNKVKATKEGEYRLDIIIIKEAEVGIRPVVVGEYKPQMDDMAKDNVRMANLYHFTGGREVHYQLSRNTMTGSVVITSVDEEKVKGRIDLSDGISSIKGNFEAKPANPY